MKDMSAWDAFLAFRQEIQRQEREEAPKRELEQKLKPKNEADCNQIGGAHELG